MLTAIGHHLKGMGRKSFEAFFERRPFTGTVFQPVIGNQCLEGFQIPHIGFKDQLDMIIANIDFSDIRRRLCAGQVDPVGTDRRTAEQQNEQ